MSNRTTGGNEPLVVPTVELAAVINRWIEEHDTLFPSERGDISAATRVRTRSHFVDGDNERGVWGYSARQWLCNAVGLEWRSLYRITHCESKYTVLSLADELLTAIERHELLDWEVHVVPNPRWSRQRWMDEMVKRGCG